METVAGFKLVRRLGSGRRADVYLGRSDAEVESGRTAAVKVFREETPLASIDTEIDALARASSPFLARLDDLGTDRRGRPVLVLGLLGPTSCSQLLVEREALTVGEAVTILAPLIDGVAELHRVGVAHRNIRLTSIGFDRIGTPVLGGFGHAEIVGPLPLESDRSSLTPVEAELIPGFLADVDQVLAVARSVFSATDDAQGLLRRATELIAAYPRRLGSFAETETETDAGAAAGQARGDAGALLEVPGLLRECLFDSADPEPIGLDKFARAPVRTGFTDGGSRARELQDTGQDGVGPRGTALGAGLPVWLESLAPFLTDLGPPVRRARAALATVRRPFWIAAGAGALLLITALVITGLVVDSPATAVGVPVGASDEGSQSSSTTTPTPEPGGGAPPTTDPALVADDPVAAASALIRARHSCIEARSVLCLDDVDQAGSAALEADSFTIRKLQDGSAAEPIDLRSASATVIEHLGGTALLGITLDPGETTDPPPAVSLLIVRGDDRWRIRDLIVG